MLEPGALIAGKLRIEKILGQGGMGLVASATHVGLDQRVAIKIMHPELANQPEIVARFVREARAAAKLKSEHVCRVTDVGEIESGQPYIEMELLDGQDLASLIGLSPLPVEIAADYVVQACVAIAEAHHLGIIHRDLKPANLFVTQRLDGTALIKVLDFGIATAPSSEDFKITKTTTVMGSPGYMSPEHLRSARDVDVRSDIWALGVILYEATSGRLPFSAQSITELAVKVVMDEPEPLTHVDPRFAAIVMRCLRKPPSDRYQNVGELAADLATLGTQSTRTTALLVTKLLGGASPSRSLSTPISAAHPSATAGAAVGLAATMATEPPQVKKSTTLQSAASASLSSVDLPPKKRRGLLVAGLAVVAVAGVGAFALVTRDTKPEHARAHPPVHRDAGADGPQLAATPTPDAPVADPHVREKLEELAANKDYRAILVLADLDQNDPQIAQVVNDAKAKYIAEETKEIAGHAQRGDCATAKVEAGEATKLVPDAEAQLTKAATCTPKKPTVPTAPTADLAADEYGKGEYAKALATAEQVLAKTPKDESALGVAARAACATNDATKAKTYVAELPVSERESIVQTCQHDGVTISTHNDGPIDVQAELRAGVKALGNKDYATASTSAKRVLRQQPNNREALRTLGIAACHLNHSQDLADVLKVAPPRAAQAIRSACGMPDTSTSSHEP
jgi:eukaryotic-like serine/threonine-protein kinase